MITLYGIKQCDKVRKARQWLTSHGIDFVFHDSRQDGLDPTVLRNWVQALGWRNVVNKQSTTWKQLDPKIRVALNEDTAVAILSAHPTMIKRPLLDTGKEYHLGFSSQRYCIIFQHHTI